MNDETNIMQFDMFHFNDNQTNFNDLAQSNGFTYWYATDYMQMLGYTSYQSFRKAINKALTTCMTIDVNTVDNFEQIERIVNNQKIHDFKLSRFACYLVAMNADNKKVEVARAQAFFAASAEAIRRYVDNSEDVERVLIRDEVTIHEKSLNRAAKIAGVTDERYGLFQNAGYRGLYNMDYKKLKQYKGLAEKKSLLDFMGKDELAANLFRITQTELKLKNDNVQGDSQAQQTAEFVGKQVRKSMLDIICLI
jgi:DNA-damage-inducible protein D